MLHQASLALAAAPGGGASSAEADALRQQCEELRRELQEARAAEARLQGEVERLTQQEAAVQLQLSPQAGLAQQAGLPGSEALDGEETAAGAVDGAALAAELVAARQAAEVAIAERDRARAQLSRCAAAVPHPHAMCFVGYKGCDTFITASLHTCLLVMKEILLAPIILCQHALYAPMELRVLSPPPWRPQSLVEVTAQGSDLGGV